MEKNIEQEANLSPKTVSAWQIHRRLYNWIIGWADTPYGGWVLFFLSLAESSFFPIPPDVLLAPLCLGNRKKWWQFALSCSVASVIGGMIGYGIGMFLWANVGGFFHEHVPGFHYDSVVTASGETVTGLIDANKVEVAMPMMHDTVNYPFSMTHLDGTQTSFTQSDADDIEVTVKPFTKTGSLYEAHNWKVVAVAGFTPLPYKVITISAGVFKINFLIFCIASAISRSARFFIVAGLIGRYGDTVEPLIDKYFNLLSLAFVVLLVGGVAVMKLL